MRIALWIFAVFLFAYQFQIYSVIPNVFNEDFQRHFVIDAAETGRLIGMFHIAYMIMQIPIGILIDRLSSKLLLTASLLISALGTMAFATTDSYVAASIAQASLGIGNAFSFVLLLKITNDSFPQKKVAMMFSLGISCGCISATLMSPTFVYLASLSSWNNVVLWFGILGIVPAFVGYFAIAEIPPIIERIENKINESVGVLDSFRIIFSNRQFIYLGLFGMAILSSANSFSNAWGASFVKTVYGVDRIQAASIVGLVNFGTIFGAPLVAFLAEKFGSYKKIMIYGSSILLILFAIAIFVKMNIVLLSVTLFAIGIVMCCEVLSFPAALTLASPKIVGTLTSVVNTITMAGNALLIPTIGGIMDFSKNNFGDSQTYSPQDYRNGMTAILFTIVFAIVILRFIKVSYPKTQIEGLPIKYRNHIPKSLKFPQM